MPNIPQYYIPGSRPASNSARDLFEFCVKSVRDKELFSKSMMHNQWAGILFGYEKNSTARIDLMSKVKREYSTYFTREMKYAFDEEKMGDMLKRHGTDNSVHDKATVAVTFTELVSCKKM